MNDTTLVKVAGMAVVAAVAIGCLALNREDGILTVVAGFVGGMFVGNEIGKKAVRN